MRDIMKIMEREIDNTDLIYIYKEADRWFVYEQSAFFLCQMFKGHLVLGKVVINNILWLVRAEINIKLIPNENFVSYCDDECVLYYAPGEKLENHLLY